MASLHDLCIFSAPLRRYLAVVAMPGSTSLTALRTLNFPCRLITSMKDAADGSTMTLITGSSPTRFSNSV